MDDISVGIRQLQRLLASRRITAQTAKVAGVDCSQQAVQVLVALGQRDAITIGVLARAAQMDTGAVSRTVKQLAADGLVDRRVDDDSSRRACISLTEHGRALVRQYEAARDDHYHRALAKWSQRDRDRFGALLLRFVHDIQATPLEPER